MKRFLLLCMLILPGIVLSQQTLDSLITLARHAQSDTAKAYLYLKAASFAYGNAFDSVPSMVEKTIYFAQKAGLVKTEIQARNILGYYYRLSSQSDSAKALFEKNLALAKKTNDSASMAAAYGNLANSFADNGQLDSAIYYYRQTLDLFEKLNNEYGLATVYGALGNVYLMSNQLQYALENYTKATGIYKDLFDKTRNVNAYDYYGLSLMNSGLVYKRMDKLDSARLFLDSARAIFKSINDQMSLNQCYANLADLDYDLGNYQKSIQYGWIVNDYFLANRMYKDLLSTTLQIANAYLHLDMDDKALKSLQWGEPFLDSLSANYDLKSEYFRTMSNLYSKRGLFDSAYYALYKSNEYYDSLMTAKNKKVVAEALEKFKADQKQKEIAFLKREKQLQQQTIRTQRWLLVMFFVGFFVILIFSILLVRLLRKIRKANNQLRELNAEITQQKEELQTQKEEIERQNRNITESINYASRIQRALLPRPDILKNVFPENFILYLPKQTVSGDFFWYYRSGNKFLIAVADCTGHGVPGALISMLGISFLNEIVKTNSYTDAADIINKLREHVKTSLKQEAEDWITTRDGMDIALLIIDLDTYEADFAGAYNPVIVVKPDGQLIETKGDKMPVGVYFKEKAFTNRKIKVEKGDMIYLFSDGYIDQFGYESNKKFMYRNFKNLLMGIANLSASKQFDILTSTLINWKGHLAQVDDITVLGFRV